jgi:hypothetical protein
VFGWPPKGLLQYKVELALHKWAAFVQRLAECRWPLSLSCFYDVFAETKTAEGLSSSVYRVTADRATALRCVLIKLVDGSVATTIEIISKVSKGDETMQTGNVRIVTVWPRKT